MPWKVDSGCAAVNGSNRAMWSIASSGVGIAEIADAVAIAVRLIGVREVRADVARIVDPVAVLVVPHRSACSAGVLACVEPDAPASDRGACQCEPRGPHPAMITARA